MSTYFFRNNDGSCRYSDEEGAWLPRQSAALKEARTAT